MSESLLSRLQPSFHGNYKRTGVILILAIASVSGFACSKAPTALETEQELADNTEIYLGDDRFEVAAVAASGAGSDAKDSDAQTILVTPDGKNSKTEEQAVGGRRQKSKPKPKPKPLDVEYILTKAKAISVGLASDTEKPRVVNEARDYVPASVTKMLTTASALKRLGPEFRYRTVVSFKRSGTAATELIISADGDPTGGVDGAAGDEGRFKKIAGELKQIGVDKIVGRVVLVPADPRLDRQKIAEGVPTEDMSVCYGASAMSFNYRGNCVLARVNSKSAITWELRDLASFVSSQIETTAGARNSIGVHPLIDTDRVLSGYRVRGTYGPKNSSTVSLHLPVPNSAGWFGLSFIAAMSRAKIAVVDDRSDDGSEDKSEPRVIHAIDGIERQKALSLLRDGGRETIEIESLRLSKIVEATNKPSDNFLADAIFKAVGARSKGELSDVIDSARASVQADIQTWLTVDGHPELQTEMSFFDGNGLSVKNRTTPRALLGVLRQLRRETFFDVFRNSLPIAGRDGTLAGRMRGTAAEGHVFAKTGTLRGAYQLAGYIHNGRGGKGDDYVPFVILTDTNERNRARAREFQDIVVARLATSVRKKQ